MASNAELGFALVTEVSDGAAGWDIVGEVLEVELPDEQADEVEVTNHSSADGRREFIGGLVDGGEATVSFNWIPGDATDDIIVALKNSREVRDWRFTLSGANAQVITVPAFIKSFKRSSPLAEQKTADITLRVSGAEVIS